MARTEAELWALVDKLEGDLGFIAPEDRDMRRTKMFTALAAAATATPLGLRAAGSSAGSNPRRASDAPWHLQRPGGGPHLVFCGAPQSSALETTVDLALTTTARITFCPNCVRKVILELEARAYRPTTSKRGGRPKKNLGDAG